MNDSTKAVQAALTDDLRRPPWRGKANPLAGHCYVASEALAHILRSEGHTVKPMFVRHEGAPHWYLLVDGVGIVDATAGQFREPPPYSEGRGKGFLTSEPSKRAAELLRRIGVTK